MFEIDHQKKQGLELSADGCSETGVIRPSSPFEVNQTDD
jgi:hypothetical protein